MAGAGKGKRKKREPLSADRIEAAALELIEHAGLADFSTRKLAAVLGCEAMSIYHYFPSKGHLMDALVNRVVAERLTVPSPTPDWRAALERSAWEWRAMALAYPNFFAYLSVHRLNTPTALRWLNGVLSLFEGLGLTPEDAVRAFRSIGYYLNGAMLDETAGYSRGPSTVAPVSDELMQRDFPAVVRAARWFTPDERERTFAAGLLVLLEGLEQLVDAPPAAGHLAAR